MTIGMTLEDAIKHCEEVARQNEEDAVVYSNCKNHKKNLYEIGLAENAEKKCRKCAEEHRQFAEWLKELKRHREAWQKVREEIGKELECADVSLKYREYQLGVNYGLGLALGVIDNALEEIEKGEQ